MKYLKYILGVLAFLVLGFFLLGFIKTEIYYESEIMVEKPVSESWAVIQDEDKLSEWLPGFQKIEHVSGTPGTIGAVSNVYFDTEGQKMTIRETIIDLIPNESIKMSYESDFMNMDYELKMSNSSGMTHITSFTTAKGNGAISKSIMALMGSSIKGQETTNLTNLKKTIEQNTKVYR